MDERLKQEEPDKVGAPNLREMQHEKIVISSGWDGDDYVWHVSTINPKIVFKVPERTFILHMIKVFQTLIPDDCKVDVWTPNQTWDIKLYTFKAWKLRDYWQISPETLDTLLKKLFVTANGLI